MRCKAFQCVRREKKSETVDGTHVRLAAIPSEKVDFVRWRFVSIDVNQHERYNGFVDRQALKAFPMSMARAASQRHTVHGHRKSTAILDDTIYIACFHKDMDEVIHEDPLRETEQDVLSYGCCSMLILQQGKPHDCGGSMFATELTSAGWNDGANCAQ